MAALLAEQPMARISFTATPTSAVRVTVDELQATVTSTLATLVADGILPTEAHVIPASTRS